MKEEEFDYLIKLLNTIQPYSHVENEVSVEKYLFMYESKKTLEYVQYLSEDDYINITEKLIELYPKDKKYYTKVLFDSFFFYVKDVSYYTKFIEFIYILKKDFPQFSNHLTVIEDLIYYFLYYEKEISFKTHNVERLKMNDFLKYFNITSFHEKHNNFSSNLAHNKIEKIGENIQNSIYEINFDTNFQFMGSHMIYIITFSYKASRYIIYNASPSQREIFFSTFLPRLEKVLNSYMKVLQENKVFPVALIRITSLISAYYNIRLRYLIDTKGRFSQEIKSNIDSYFDIMYKIYKILLPSTSPSTIHRTVINFIEIINYYNYCGISLSSGLATIHNNIYNFSEFYKSLILSIQHSKLGLSYIFDKFKLSYSFPNFNTTISAMFEMSVFISSYSLICSENENDREMGNIVQASKQMLEQLYDVQSNEIRHMSLPHIELNYVWF